MKASSKKIQRSLIITITTSVILISVAVFISFSENDRVYLREIENHREAKDNYLKSSPDTPILDTASFSGLCYYPADKKFVITATVRMLLPADTVSLTQSNGEETGAFLKVATAIIKFLNKPDTLSVFRYINDSSESPKWFIPFADKTNNKSTYGGGRYLDVIPVEKGRGLVIDFNKAYHPYCAYYFNYLCPLPPKENRLDLEIRAGEKNCVSY